MNSAYLNKLFDVRLTELAKALPSGAKITPSQARLSFGVYESDIRRALIPVWNVDKRLVKGDDFPVPAADKVNYEYRFGIEKLGADNGYLMDYDSAPLLSTRMEENTIIAVSPESRNLKWDIYRIRKRRDRVMDAYAYPVISNRRKDIFSTRLMSRYGIEVKTKAELRKLAASFEAEEWVTLESMRFAGGESSGESYSMNPFIHDEIRDPAYQKTLLLSFKATKRDFFLTRDMMSFLVSQVQLIYPEYRCVGVLL
jgi:hypothetical protein